MKNKLLSFVIAAVFLLSSLSISVYGADNEGNIVILFESDVHCNADGYAKIAMLRNEEQEKGNGVVIVSCGDFIQGGTLGAFSKGQYIIDIMNAVGYDVVTIGNHEFDYSIPVLEDLMNRLNAQAVSCNYVRLPDKTTVYAPYEILSFGDTDIAFVGVTTPESITKTTPKYFTDDNGEYLYDFCGENLCETIQSSVDDAIAQGADYVVALSHLGTEYVTEKWAAQEIAKNTRGIDVMLDGHSHSIIESETIPNIDNEDVLISSVGTKFEKIGKLTVSRNGEMTAELIDTADYENKDMTVDEALKAVMEEYAAEGGNVLGNSDVKLSTYDEEGNWIIRSEEANIGNFCADAYRAVLDADIGLMNGGGIKEDIEEGDITYNDILAVLPWENTVCSARAAGQTILDLLEYSVKAYPEASGSFQQVSGIRFSYDPSIPTPVKLDEKGVYVGIDGERRVWKAEILNRETNEYESIDPNKLYTVASTSYLLKDSGGGNTIFDSAEIINDADLIDTSVIREYIQDFLDGTIGEEYGYTEDRINIAEKTEEDTDESTENAEGFLTRAEACDIILKAAYDYNPDVSKENVMRGDGSGNLNEDREVTKLEVFIMMNRAFGKYPQTNEAGKTINAEYADIPKWAESDMEQSVSAGIADSADGINFGSCEKVAKDDLQKYLKSVYALFS